MVKDENRINNNNNNVNNNTINVNHNNEAKIKQTDKC